jgi:hypothetical protein
MRYKNGLQSSLHQDWYRASPYFDFTEGDEQAPLHFGIQFQQSHRPLEVQIRGLERVHGNPIDQPMLHLITNSTPTNAFTRTLAGALKLLIPDVAET